MYTSYVIRFGLQAIFAAALIAPQKIVDSKITGTHFDTGAAHQAANDAVYLCGK